MTNVQVDKQSANWRLFGGGGLALGGLLQLIAGVLEIAAPGYAALVVLILGLVVAGVAYFFVAFGQTGSNGAVGALGWGKVVLVIAGTALALLGITLALIVFANVNLPFVTIGVLSVIFLLASLAASFAIFGRGVAKGIAKWALFVPSVWAIVEVVGSFGVFGDTTGWVDIVFGILLLLTGLAYLFNKTDIPGR
jgi:hypothetical protein